MYSASNFQTFPDFAAAAYSSGLAIARARASSNQTIHFFFKVPASNQEFRLRKERKTIAEARSSERKVYKKEFAQLQLNGHAPRRKVLYFYTLAPFYEMRRRGKQ